jgi:hypothetical protein
MKLVQSAENATIFYMSGLISERIRFFEFFGAQAVTKLAQASPL